MNTQELKKYPSVIERYYDQKYVIDVNGNEGQDQYIYEHTNGLFVIGLAPKHEIFVKDLEIKEVNFVIDDMDLTKNTVRGTKKKGGMRMKKDSIIAKIICNDGKQYSAYSCVNGNLLEVNTELIENPSLLKKFPTSKGYLAIIQPPKEKNIVNNFSNLLTSSEYELKRNK